MDKLAIRRTINNGYIISTAYDSREWAFSTIAGVNSFLCDWVLGEHQDGPPKKETVTTEVDDS